MKLITREKGRYVFLIGEREREMMIKLLRMYPVLRSDYQQATKDPSLTRVDPELMREALAEQQKANKELVRQMLAAKGRFTRDEFGFRFAVKHSEMEWLLQVFNDVRVGSWVKLDSPDPGKTFGAKLTEENLQITWAMEMSGFFEHSILEALA